VRSRFLLGAVIAALVAVPFLASAKHADLSDADDTRGLLDIAKVGLHGQERPVWKVITFPKWGTERVFDRGYGLVHLDVRGDSHFEYFALVRSVGSRLDAELFRNRKRKPDFSVGSVQVWRADRKSFSVRVPLARMRVAEDRLFYRWFVQTLMTGRSCPQVCIDRVPDEGNVQQPLGIPTPEPTPTPTITVEPTPDPSASVEPTPGPTP
jgi:hypothetical protein